MHPHEQLIREFYSAFQTKDYGTMQRLYRNDASFSDPVFVNLTANEARAMWQMLITGASDLRIEVSDIKADDRVGSCVWQAWYTFTATGRPVHNIIQAKFTFREGKILSHIDKFDFWRWARQALGNSGLLLGWTPFLLSKVRSSARHRLSNFLKSK